MDDKVTAEVAWIESMKPMVGKRIEVEYGQHHDWVRTSGTMRGWLEEYHGRLILVKRRGSNRLTYLTNGLHDGFYATITVKKVHVVHT